jgi:hypothetical protein
MAHRYTIESGETPLCEKFLLDSDNVRFGKTSIAIRHQIMNKNRLLNSDFPIEIDLSAYSKVN